jgi:hypothetical protein
VEISRGLAPSKSYQVTLKNIAKVYEMWSSMHIAKKKIVVPLPNFFDGFPPKVGKSFSPSP